MIKLIIIGDVVAKIGRRVVRDILPDLKKKYKPDAIIANVENLAHGKGVTKKSLGDIQEYGVDAFTGGNHIWSHEDPNDSAIQSIAPLALPANNPNTHDENPWREISIAKKKLFVLNLLGQVMMHDEATQNPFLYFDTLFEKMGKPRLLLVDLHAEATSEKVAFGHYVTGRASLVYGTHTHIPTADARILSEKTGYITDVGMTGSNDSVIGVEKETVIKRFLTEEKQPFDYPENGPAWFNALYCEIDIATGHCRKLEKIARTLTIK